MPTSAELFEVLSGAHDALGWATVAGMTKLRLRVRAYADGREWSVCIFVNGHEIDDKDAPGWTSETWIDADDSTDTIRAAAIVMAEDLQAQRELTLPGSAA